MGLVTHPSFEAAKPAGKAPAKTAKKKGPAKPQRPAMEILRLQNPAHALLCPPADYIDCRDVVEHVTPEMIDGEPAVFSLTYAGKLTGFSDRNVPIWTCPSDEVPHPGALTWPTLKRTRRTDIDLKDVAGRLITLSQFSPPKNWHDRKPGDKLNILGSIKRFGPKLSLSVIKEAPERAVGRIWPQYEGISGQIAGERIEILVNGSVDSEDAYLACAALMMGETGQNDEDLMASCGTTPTRGFKTCVQMLRALHRPSNIEEGRLALEYARRITALGIQASALRHHLRHPHPKAPIPVNKNSVIKVMAGLGMPLTQGQQEVALQVTERLAQPKPLNALLSGDVGTGKTLAFLAPAVAAHLAGARVAIITPRTLLADQIASEILKRFDAQGVTVERVPTGGKIKDHSAILVSTHGLATSARRSDYTPQFLICDEQHKFSADAREALVAPNTHVLEVSATPVPRSLAASLYEGMEILNLRECPVEKTIHSEIRDMTDRREVIAGIKHTLANGGIAAMIYPMVNSAENSDSHSVTSAFESMNAAFPGQAVMLHGEMSDEEMRENIAKLRNGEKRLVVASTVLEIGIDIPSVNFMAVRNADRFGISQLHQLRGRLVRNGGVGVFMMVVEDMATTPPQSLERLQAVAETNDGYRLAEMDLVQRGFGDLDGSAQSGASSTIFRNIKLKAEDFLARKLKTIAPVESTRDYNQTESAHRPRQERLL